MPLRVGTDLASVAAVQESLRQHAERYLDRIYTAREQADCGGAPERLAARFAAKEAALKVLRPGPDDAVPLKDIEVRRSPDGWVELSLSGRAAALAGQRDISSFSVSLSHEAGMASAVVIAEVSDGCR